METAVEFDSDAASTEGLREYQEYLASRNPKDVATERTFGVPVELVRPMVIESRHQAGLLLAGLACSITTPPSAVAGAFIRIYGHEDIQVVAEELLAAEPPKHFDASVMYAMQEIAQAASVGSAVYSARDFAQTVAHFMSDEHRAELAASLSSYQSPK